MSKMFGLDWREHEAGRMNLLYNTHAIIQDEREKKADKDARDAKRKAKTK